MLVRIIDKSMIGTSGEMCVEVIGFYASGRNLELRTADINQTVIFPTVEKCKKAYDDLVAAAKPVILKKDK